MEASETPMGSLSKDLEVRHCRVLLAVGDTGGVGAAARALGVAQSTVSETLLSLERLLGAPVIMRRPGRGVALTSAAKALMPHARLLVSGSEAALAAVANQRGAIRLGAVESISSFLLPGPLSAFRANWPQIDVQIAIGLCEELRARVGRAELDAALTIEGARRPAPRRNGEPSATSLRFVVAPCHPLTQSVVTRRDLETQRLLLADHAGAFNVLLSAWLDGARRPRLESAGSIDGVKRGVSNSEAIGVLPDYAVAEELSAGSLVELRLHEAPPPVELQLITLKPPEAGSPIESLTGHVLKAAPALIVRTSEQAL